MSDDENRIKFCVGCGIELLWRSVACGKCGAQQPEIPEPLEERPFRRDVPMRAVKPVKARKPLPAPPLAVPAKPAKPAPPRRVPPAPPGTEPPSPHVEVPPGYRECPRCAEHIRVRARVCRFCGCEPTPRA